MFSLSSIFHYTFCSPCTLFFRFNVNCSVSSAGNNERLCFCFGKKCEVKMGGGYLNSHFPIPHCSVMHNWAEADLTGIVRVCLKLSTLKGDRQTPAHWNSCRHLLPYSNSRFLAITYSRYMCLIRACWQVEIEFILRV